MLYFDNASTTKISKHALAVYNKASEDFFNPSGLYKAGSDIKNKIDNVRKEMLTILKGSTKSTLIFTSCATESNNTVLHSCITRKDKRYIFSQGEHSSVYQTAKKYQEQGYDVIFIPLLTNGAIDENILLNEITPNTAFVSIIHVSNETGAINDIKSLSTKIKAKNPNILIHSDGVQAVGKVDIDLESMKVDFYSISAHKINGPKGMAALYIASPNKFQPFLHGGGQESNLRAGTENVPAILSFMEALKDIEKHDFSLYKQAFVNNLSGDFLLVSDNSCVDNIISVCFKGIRGETIQHMLEDEGYIIGTGSACNSKATENRVLKNIVPKSYLSGALRISFGNYISIQDCKNLALTISKLVEQYLKRTKR